MRRAVSLAFRPAVERAEDRCLATVSPVISHIAAVHGLAGQAHQAMLHPVRHGGVVMMAAPLSGGQGQLPSGFQDWGAITLWNTTNHRVTFSVSASTYQNGRYFNFTLRPGSFQVYYAAYDQFNNAPVFHVSFDPIHQSNAIQVSDINTVFERVRWFPWQGTEGRPYAIATDVSGLHLTPI